MEKRTIDWERIELDYRAGILTLREIAAESGITHGAINAKAKRLGWDRDLSAKIRAKADALVSKATVSTEVSKERADTERAVIEAGAAAIVEVKMRERGQIKRGSELVDKLFAELTGITDRPDLIEELSDALAAVDEVGKLRDALARVTGLPGRVNSLKALTESLKNMISLERQAWNLDDQPPEKPPADREQSDPVERARRIAFAVAQGAAALETKQVH